MTSGRSNNDIDARPLAGSSKRFGFTDMCFVAGTFFIYFFSNPKPQSYYDYTFRVGENFLHGMIGLSGKQPSWLNEMIPFGGLYYSAFPLGSVLTMLPFSFLKFVGLINEMPGAFIAALIAGLACLFLLLIGKRYELTSVKKMLLAAAVLFGTWMWTNLTMDGAWQLALGFAVLGELGAIYFTVYDRRPFLAGLFFALAFGNRTEIILTAPVFVYLLSRKDLKPDLKEWRPAAYFCAIPFILGVATLTYNYFRFDSFTDFGYARIPGVLLEPWYRDGIFSLSYIPGNFWEMLVTPWKILDKFPYLVPTGFGGAIWWSSPFLFLLFRTGAKDKILKYTAWAAIILLTFLLWTHGNAGGWQFSYRYAMILLPWMYLILMENSPENISWWEWMLYVFSFAANAFATYLFHWTEYVKP
jgi:hypothetical protein